MKSALNFASVLATTLSLTRAAPTLDLGIPSALTENFLYGAPENDFDCTSEKHPNPVVMLHGLSANRDIDLSILAKQMKKDGFCVFGKTYGWGYTKLLHLPVTWIGGVTDMRESAKDIADFIQEVKDKTQANKIDIIGHSEGAVQGLYVPMTQGDIHESIERIIALGPAINGATYYNFTELWYLGGDITRIMVSHILDDIGCKACDDMATDGDIYNDFKNSPKIIQPDNKVTVVMSRADKLVPPATSLINEDDVRNVYVQDTCPDDPVGHGSLVWDKSVWNLIYQAMNDDYDTQFWPCEKGLQS